MKLTKILLIILMILFIIYVSVVKHKNSLSLREDFMEYKPNYVFWTGGYDSTFRICELLIIYKVPVQPIYLAYNLDSAKDTDFWVRKNRKQEKNAMDKIKKALFKKFPFTKNLLYNTIFIKENNNHDRYDKAFKELNLWPKKRRIHQYSHLGKISYMMKTYIDIGVLGIHQRKSFVRFLHENLTKEEGNYKLDLNTQHPLHYLKFPLFKKTKKMLCQISKKYFFGNILQLSWSCWFPNKNGSTCGKCPMCIERFNCN